MCSICDGATFDEVCARYQRNIERYGWTAVEVEAGPHGRGWTYTIGLTSTFDVPELVVVGGCGHCAHKRFRELIDPLVTDWGDDPPSEVIVCEQRLGIVKVQPHVWETDRFNAWLEHRWRYPHDGRPRALQLLFADANGILPGEPGVDLEVQRSQKRLDRPRPQQRTGTRRPRGQG